jgi:hypothetical protein
LSVVGYYGCVKGNSRHSQTASGKVIFVVSERSQMLRPKQLENSVFINTGWETILQAMKQPAAFESVKMKAPQETKIGSPFVTLLGTKSKESTSLCCQVQQKDD